MSNAYEIILQGGVRRELEKVPQDIRRKIDKVIFGLRENPRPFGVKKLEENLHRVRIGNCRVIYAIFDREQQIVILHVVRRTERTYKG